MIRQQGEAKRAGGQSSALHKHYTPGLLRINNPLEIQYHKSRRV